MGARLLFQDLDLVTPNEVIRGGKMLLTGDRFRSVGADSPSEKGVDFSIEGMGLTAFPGLMNIHDHLVGTWSPRAGEGPYPNIYHWLDAYTDHPVRRERMTVPMPLILRLGGLRNLLGGTTTVLEHFERMEPGLTDGLPIRVVRDFGREWVWRSVTHPDRYPPWGEGIEKEMAMAGEGEPFVIHISEGIDEESRKELGALDRAVGLARKMILVHGVAFTPADIERIAAVGAKVVWCPCSNHFLYGETTDVRHLLRSGVAVSLGTDSTVTGSAHILDELRYARKTYREKYGEEISPDRLVAMVTSVPARALLRETELGALKAGAVADLILVESEVPDPFERLLQAQPRDLDLVLSRGIPVLGSLRHEALFRALTGTFSRVRIQGREKWIVGDPAALIGEIRGGLGYEKAFHFLPLDA
ncbi:MAG: amidohydrolase family protein [Planctomycetota bacterium]|jgi:cytosine/adenosine deaminase-related metal-dependent hydrolase